MIRCSKHSISRSNRGKVTRLNSFIDEYRRVAGLYIDHIWERGYEWTDNKGEQKIFYIPDKQYEHPGFIDYNIIKVETSLSARALSSLVTQLCGILGASVEKQRKRLYILEKLLSEGKKPSKSFLKKIEENNPVKPSIHNLLPEISSKCADLEMKTDGEFNAFLRLKSIGESFKDIKIPIKFTKVSNKWMNKGKIKCSFQISKKFAWIRYEIENKIRETGETIGADQGKITMVTFSNEMTTPDTDAHGHSFSSIIDKLSKKKKGTVNFKQAQEHRKNFINWSINQLNLDNIKEIKLEKVWNINYKKKTSRKMSHWTNTLIRDKIQRFAEENEVRFSLQEAPFKSQRCSECGYVRKSNRQKKWFSCGNCKFSCDADLNSAKNQKQELPTVPFEFRKMKLNLKGFFWNHNGFFSSSGEALRVPHPYEKV